MIGFALSGAAALTDGLLLYLSCDEGAGNVLADASPTHAVVSAHGKLAWAQAPGFGSAVNFQPDEMAHLQVRHDFGTLESVTVAFRCLAEESDAPRSNYFLDTRGEDFGELDGAFYLSRHRDGFLQMVNPTTRLPSDAYPRKTWFHLAVVADANVVRFFVDGKLAAEGDPVSLNIGDRLVLGNRHSRDQALIGMMDEIALWNRKLDAEEILRLKNQPLPVMRRVQGNGKLNVLWAQLKSDRE